MRFIDLVQLVGYNLGRRKGSVMLTAIGVVIGTAAVVVLVSLALLDCKRTPPSNCGALMI